ncbi:MAG: hypothetical protein M1831_004561 [Alyxoria varia]|nr:MAG: hypothetical protein M1831_004561 [Alyxoria varia]
MATDSSAPSHQPPVPRVFIVRHGETSWSLSGRHTGTTDIPLTANGERRICATGRALFGPDRLVVPANLAAVFVSPRVRARRTWELLRGEGCPHEEDLEGRVEVRSDVAEWDYGDFEGRTSRDIGVERSEQGLGKWDIWRDGSPGGESPEQITQRLDKVIAELRQRFHAPAMNRAHDEAQNPTGPSVVRSLMHTLGHRPPSDVLIVAHGHILRAFAARWVGKSIADNPSLLLEAGGVGTLSYEHHNLEEPAILLGGAFVVGK